MSYYRLYFIDLRTGRIVRFSEIEAPSDAAAIEEARKESGQYALELWCRARQVLTIEAIDVAQVAPAARQISIADQHRSAMGGIYQSLAG